MENNKNIIENYFVEIGIIRMALDLAFKTGHITSETQEECERLIMKLQKLNEVFNFTNDTHYTWRY